jgi:hypothetical protein
VGILKKQIPLPKAAEDGDLRVRDNRSVWWGSDDIIFGVTEESEQSPGRRKARV